MRSVETTFTTDLPQGLGNRIVVQRREVEILANEHEDAFALAHADGWRNPEAIAQRLVRHVGESLCDRVSRNLLSIFGITIVTARGLAAVAREVACTAADDRQQDRRAE